MASITRASARVDRHRGLGVWRRRRSRTGENAASTGQRAAEVAQLDRDQRRVRARAGGGDERGDRLGGRRRRAAGGRPCPGTGPFGSLWISISAGGRHRARTCRAPARARAAGASTSGSPRIAASTTTSLRPRSGAGTSGSGGTWRIRHSEVTSSGTVSRPLAPGVEDLLGALPRPRHRARGQRLDRVELELHRGHDAEVPAAAAQRAEQLGLVARRRCGRGSPSAVTSSIAVTLSHAKPVLAREPAEAAAERVADDADVVRGARQRREPVGRGGRRSRPPTARRRGRARVRALGSIRTPRMRLVESRIVPSSERDRAPRRGPCPGARRAGPPRGRSRRPRRRRSPSAGTRPRPAADRRRGSTRAAPRPSRRRPVRRPRRRGGLRRASTSAEGRSVISMASDGRGQRRSRASGDP